MSKQDQLEILFDQYRDELDQVYNDCMQTGQFYAGEFNNHLAVIWKSAKEDGMEQYDFEEIVQDVVNEYIDHIFYPFPTSMAA
ncbi:hypothetical protein [Halobacteriovorax sp. HLS]|uniref:hypothetical protein n=1 Tax=Halobacteriovorax sp. HLS TaxID=2234000 RepID=UPI000FD8E088|nr:hypothetical protein [Halobacteriovorax sp. HLS]